MNTQEQLKLVKEFMKVAGQKVNSEPTYQSTKVSDFRTSLIDEEINGTNELVESVQKDDLIGIVDGMADILYVVYGALATFGISIEEYKLFKREENHASILYKHIASGFVRNIQSAFEQYKRGVDCGDIITIRRGLTGIILEVNRFAEAANYDLIGAFDEVHASNMSKFCKTAQDAKDSIVMRIEANDKNSKHYVGAGISAVYVGDKTYYAIVRKEDGKVLKGKDYFEADLAKFA